MARSPAKRPKLTPPDHHHPLLPGLPDHVAKLCLSRLHAAQLSPVCRSWRRLIYSPSFPPFLSLYALFSSSSSSTSTTAPVRFLCFDPISSEWDALPPSPPLPLIIHHPSFISRSLSVQSISVAGNLILLAATNHNFYPALCHPLVFSPLSGSWYFGPAFATPRRWCAAGASCGAVYVASGFGSHFSADVARSLEKWDLHGDGKDRSQWKKMRGLKDGRFSREAINAVGWRGKLCMVNVKGAAAKEGVVYDIEKDAWEGMPKGMVAGWRGPAAAMDEQVMFAVDEAEGKLVKYEEEIDEWKEIMENELLIGARQMTAGGGRVCVVCAAGEIAVVDVLAEPPRLWLLNGPAGLEAVAVHILPRMSRPDF